MSVLTGKRLGDPFAGWVATLASGAAFICTLITFFALHSRSEIEGRAVAIERHLEAAPFEIGQTVDLLGEIHPHGHRGGSEAIVSGGGAEFMRAWAEKVYGIPPEQVIGSTIKV